jgi:VWFA-related protein
MLPVIRVCVNRPSLILLCTVLIYSLVPGQTSQQSRDDVVRVFTELVQTDVMVFDKQGKFVNGLKQEDFELKIDGKSRPIVSFEQITAGSDEETQLAAARGSSITTGKRAVPLDRGRTVFFYVDDFHMDLSGMVTAKDVIKRFINNEMGQNDQAAVTSATGQIGFLQQLTNNRMVLQAAMERLNPRSYSIRDAERPPMTEYQALLIERQDPTVTEFFVTETIRNNPGIGRDTALSIVRGRSNVIQSQAAIFNQNTLFGLERLVKTVKTLPGRKVVFFLSGGFLVENRNGNIRAKLRDITAASAKSGVVIYSMDVRGLMTGVPEASSEQAFDPSGRLDSATRGELTATQDGMHALAADTGGRSIFNTNDLKQGLAPAIKETSAYYLLAWKPDTDTQKQSRFRSIQVGVIGRPDLTVRVRKGYFDLDPTSQVAANTVPVKPEETKTVPAKLREAIIAAYPSDQLPVSLGIDYYDLAGKGGTVSTAIQIPGEFLVFGEQPDGKIQAVIDLTGVFFDDKGTPKASFLERIVTTAPSLEEAKSYHNDITFTYPTQLTPGLYQVRIAARDNKSAKLGTAHGWIEVPDLSKGNLSMSSLLLGERTPAMITNVSDNNAVNPVALSASHRFRRQSNLRFLLFAYNTAPSTADKNPDVAVQVQVVRDDQPVITTALRKIGTEGVLDLTRIPYAAEIPLEELQPGQYILKVTLIDRVSKQSSSRQTHFDVY